MSHFFRLLLLSPTVFAPIVSLIIAAKPAHANTTTWVPVTQGYSCARTVTREPKQLVCKRVNAGTSEAEVIDLTKAGGVTSSTDIDGMNGVLPDTFEMTDEESNASVALFGCDCPACVRSLRQLRSMMS